MHLCSPLNWLKKARRKKLWHAILWLYTFIYVEYLVSWKTRIIGLITLTYANTCNSMYLIFTERETLVQTNQLFLRSLISVILSRICHLILLGPRSDFNRSSLLSLHKFKFYFLTKINLNFIDILHSCFLYGLCLFKCLLGGDDWQIWVVVPIMRSPLLFWCLFMP